MQCAEFNIKYKRNTLTQRMRLFLFLQIPVLHLDIGNKMIFSRISIFESIEKIREESNVTHVYRTSIHIWFPYLYSNSLSWILEQLIFTVLASL